MPERSPSQGSREAPLIRTATDDDALDLIELIGSVFGEYPHCVLDVDGEMPELRKAASYHADHGGVFWIALRGEHAVGCAGYVTHDRPEGQVVELKKLYVHRRERKSGLGGMMVDRVEAAASERSATAIDLWSDTRFVTAHAFYERRGYERGPNTRELHDKSNTVEFYFKKTLGPR